MDVRDIKQERCFCVSKNSPSANVHGCTFADRVSTPSIFKRLLSKYTAHLLFSKALTEYLFSNVVFHRCAKSEFIG